MGHTTSQTISSVLYVHNTIYFLHATIRSKVESESHSVMSEPSRLLCSWDFPGKNTGVGCHCLLQGIFLTQGSNPGSLHCRQILYCLSYQGSPLYEAGLFLTPFSTWGNGSSEKLSHIMRDAPYRKGPIHEGCTHGSRVVSAHPLQFSR